MRAAPAYERRLESARGIGEMWLSSARAAHGIGALDGRWREPLRPLVRVCTARGARRAPPVARRRSRAAETGARWCGAGSECSASDCRRNCAWRPASARAGLPADDHSLARGALSAREGRTSRQPLDRRTHAIRLGSLRSSRLLRELDAIPQVAAGFPQIGAVGRIRRSVRDVPEAQARELVLGSGVIQRPEQGTDRDLQLGFLQLLADLPHGAAGCFGWQQQQDLGE